MWYNDPMADTPQLFSIGHSKVPIERFLALLHQHAIRALCDVRSVPSSRFAPQFNRARLGAALADSGIAYRFMGDQLGGRPSNPALRTEDGARPDYAKIAASPAFASGVTALIDCARLQPTAYMCSEAAYQKCHRHWLLVPALTARGVQVWHILPDGNTAPGVIAPEQTHMSL